MNAEVDGIVVARLDMVDLDVESDEVVMVEDGVGEVPEEVEPTKGLVAEGDVVLCGVVLLEGSNSDADDIVVACCDDVLGMAGLVVELGQTVGWVSCTL